MSRNVRVLHCTPEEVFAVLGDGWLYPAWVVGASRMRDVDESWPEAGAELQHSVGAWPFLVNDKTVVDRYAYPRTLVLRARAWPVGEARVTLGVTRKGDETRVRMDEEVVAGPAQRLPRPLMNLLLHLRNRETLHRLAYLAEGRSARRDESTTAAREIPESKSKREQEDVDRERAPVSGN